MPDPVGTTSPDLPSRLAARAGKLRLLVASLTGPSLRAQYEVDDFVQETFVRALCEATPLSMEDAALDRHLALVARHVVIDAARSLRAAKREGDRCDAALGIVQRRIVVRGPLRRAHPRTEHAGRGPRAVAGPRRRLPAPHARASPRARIAAVPGPHRSRMRASSGKIGDRRALPLPPGVGGLGAELGGDPTP